MSKTEGPRFLFLAMCVVVAALAIGCENDDDDSEELVNTNTTPTVTDPAKVLLGVWKGTAGTAQRECEVFLSEYFVVSSWGNIRQEYEHGKVTWYNKDRRAIVNAVYNPPNLHCDLYLDDGSLLNFTEYWELKYNGSSLSGIGVKPFDSTNGQPQKYDIHLTRD